MIQSTLKSVHRLNKRTININPLCAIVNDGPNGTATIAASITRAQLAEQNGVTEQFRMCENLALNLKLFALSDDVATGRLFDFHFHLRFVYTKYYSIIIA